MVTTKRINFETVELQEIQGVPGLNPILSSKGSGYITIINSKNAGRRIELSKKTTELLELQDGEAINIAIVGDDVLISKKLPGCEKDFIPRRQKSKLTVYNAEIVKLITSVLSLDIGETKVSHTFREDDIFLVDSTNEYPVIAFNNSNSEGDTNDD